MILYQAEMFGWDGRHVWPGRQQTESLSVQCPGMGEWAVSREGFVMSTWSTVYTVYCVYLVCVCIVYWVCVECGVSTVQVVFSVKCVVCNV